MSSKSSTARIAATGAIAAALAASALAFAAPATAQDVTIRLGHRLPAGHYIQTQLVDVFMNAVTERTGGAVTFELYPAAQLGATPATMSSGLLDMGVITTGSHPDLFPLSPVGELPQSAATACEGSARIAALARPGGILAEQEFGPQGLRVLSGHMLAPYVLFTRDTVINGLDDVSGLKIWASGPAAEEAIRAMNGVPIRIPSTELFDAATRGTVDAAIFPFSGIMQYGLIPTFSNAVYGVNFGSGVFFMAINDSDWAALSADQQHIFEEEAQSAQRVFCEYIDASDVEQRTAAEAIEGFKAGVLEGEGLAEMDAVLNEVAQAWAARLNGAGRPGSEALEAHRAVVVE